MNLYLSELLFAGLGSIGGSIGGITEGRCLLFDWYGFLNISLSETFAVLLLGKNSYKGEASQASRSWQFKNPRKHRAGKVPSSVYCILRLGGT